MSRIGKQPIKIPENVEVQIDGQKIVIKGPKGELKKKVLPEIRVEKKDNEIIVSPKSDSTLVRDKQVKAFWGLERALLQNMIIGVTEGYQKQLELRGVGYRAKLEEENLVLEVGFTHPVTIIPPKEISFAVEKSIVTVSGIDKIKVGQTAAKIRKVRPPDVYKGKGVRYLGEEIKLKPGKKAVAAG